MMYSLKYSLISLLFLFSIVRGSGDVAQVVVSVTDLRSLPQTASVSYAYDSLQLTQLVYSEYVEVYKRGVISSAGDEWWFVGALEQDTYNSEGDSIPYPGFILASHLKNSTISQPEGTQYVVRSNYLPIYERDCHLVGCLPENMVTVVPMGSAFLAVSSNDGWLQLTQPGSDDSAWCLESGAMKVGDLQLYTEDQLRSSIVDIATHLLGVYYFWGGRSPFNGDMYTSNTQLTGMDCSGFVSLSYRANGAILPRNANDIFVWGKNVTSGPQDLKVADFLYNAHPDNPNHVTHIMMIYQRKSQNGVDDLIMESATNSTRIISSEAKFGMGIDQLQWGSIVNGNIIYWGTAFPLPPSALMPVDV